MNKRRKVRPFNQVEQLRRCLARAMELAGAADIAAASDEAGAYAVELDYNRAQDALASNDMRVVASYLARARKRVQAAAGAHPVDQMARLAELIAASESPET